MAKRWFNCLGKSKDFCVGRWKDYSSDINYFVGIGNFWTVREHGKSGSYSARKRNWIGIVFGGNQSKCSGSQIGKLVHWNFRKRNRASYCAIGIRLENWNFVDYFLCSSGGLCWLNGNYLCCWRWQWNKSITHGKNENGKTRRRN